MISSEGPPGLRSSHSSPSSCGNTPFFPTVEGPMVWDHETLLPSQYTHHLTPDSIAQIESAASHFKSLNLPPSSITPLTFPLPTLSTYLKSLSWHIHHGTGVVLLRGLDARKYDDLESVIVFAGVACHICPQRATSTQHGLTLTHIRDATHDPIPPSRKGLPLPGSKVPDPLKFHTDRFAGDVLALYNRSLGPQGTGGTQSLASFPQIYNNLRFSSPGTLTALAKPDWPFFTGSGTGTAAVRYGPAVWLPGNGHGNEYPIIQLSHAPLTGTARSPRPTHIPQLSAKQTAALEVLERTAKELGIALGKRQEGDILFVNNLGVLHARGGYEECKKGEKKGKGRHLLRLFLRDPAEMWGRPDAEEAWEGDAVFEYKYAYEKQGSGIEKEQRKQFLPIRDFDPWVRTASGSWDDHG